jgi:hypothetical protein
MVASAARPEPSGCVIAPRARRATAAESAPLRHKQLFQAGRAQSSPWGGEEVWAALSAPQPSNQPPSALTSSVSAIFCPTQAADIRAGWSGPVANRAACLSERDHLPCWLHQTAIVFEYTDHPLATIPCHHGHIQTSTPTVIRYPYRQGRRLHPYLAPFNVSFFITSH